MPENCCKVKRLDIAIARDWSLQILPVSADHYQTTCPKSLKKEQLLLLLLLLSFSKRLFVLFYFS